MRKTPHSDETKKKLSDNYKFKTEVVIDGKTYNTLKEVSDLYGVYQNTIHYRCKIGELQRQGKHLVHEKKGTPLPDYRGWYCTVTKKSFRKVVTPDGEFDRVSYAAKHYNITSAGILNRIKHQPGYYYKDET